MHSFCCLSPRNGALTHKQCTRGGRHWRLFPEFCEVAVGTWFGWTPKDSCTVSAPHVWHAQDHTRVPGLLCHPRIGNPPQLWCRIPIPSQSAQTSPRSCTCICSHEPFKSPPGRSGPLRPPAPLPMTHSRAGLTRMWDGYGGCPSATPLWRTKKQHNVGGCKCMHPSSERLWGRPGGAS